MAKLFANSGDPDQTPCSAASDLGLHCLPITLLRVSQLQWVKSYFRENTKYTITYPVDSIGRGSFKLKGYGFDPHLGHAQDILKLALAALSHDIRNKS